MTSSTLSAQLHSCTHCQRFVLRREHFTRTEWNIALPYTTADIVQSHKDGCALFSDPSFLDWNSAWTLRLKIENTHDWRTLDGCSWEMRKQDADGNESNIQSIRMKAWPSPATEELCGQVAMSLNPYVGSENSLKWARKWLTTYHGTHSLCAQSSVGNFVPTRLLQVLVDDKGTMVRLVEAPPADVEWAALSYVWGGDLAACMGLFPTLEQLRTSCSDQTLPQTVRDAVRVCVGLELECLWIDIFCILQEDHDDKTKELALMPKVYQLAWVTISASTAKDVSQGFLEDRDFYAPDETMVSLPYISADGTRHGSIVGSIGIHAQFGDPTRFHESEPIHSRAWTYQERRLSPRLLDFSKWNLMCICRTGAFCEGDGSIDWSSPPREWYWALPSTRLKVENSIPCLESQRLPSWHSVVQEYASRKLTFSMDKLTAIGALAQLYKEKGRTPYVAGLWKESLIDDICWVVFPECKPQDGTLLPRPRQYRAPSWSWAASDVHERSYIHFISGKAEKGPIFGPPCAQTRLVTKAKIVRVAIDQEPPNSTYGQIRAGYLLVERLMVDTLWDPMSFANPFPFRYYHPRIFRDALEPETFMMHYEKQIPVTLVVVKIGLREVQNFRCCHIFGLILLPIASGRYRRAGAFEFLDPQPKYGLINNLRDEPPVQFVRRIVEIV